MTNELMPAWMLVVLAIGLGVDALSGYFAGRTAQSKGFSFGLFFVLSFLSWFVIATIAVFIKPRSGYPEIEGSRKSLSWILYFLGLGAYVLGVFVFSILWGSQAAGGVVGVAMIGACLLLVSSMGLIISAVALARSKASHSLQNFTPDIN